MLTTCWVDGVKVSIDDYKKTDGKQPVCPLSHRLIAKKGKKVVHHFAHYPGDVCDRFREGMTYWHAQWQKIVLDKMNLEVCLDLSGQILGYSAFQGYGSNAQAVIVAAQAESHIADIIKPSNLGPGHRPMVIEVQHSSISKDKIESREKYYQRMIWLFDFTPRMVTAEKCNRIVFVDGRISYLKDKVTYIAMISCPQSQYPAQSPSFPAQTAVNHGRTFDQIELLHSNSDNGTIRPDLRIENVTRTQSDVVYCKGDECENETLTPVSGFFMIISTRTKYWLDTSKPTYFDCGFGILRFLLKLNQSFILVQCLSYEDFIRERMPPTNQEKLAGADWFKTISPALLIKLGMIPRMIDVARIQLCKTKVIFHHKGLELQDMGLEQGMDDWHAGTFYVNSTVPQSYSTIIAGPLGSPTDDVMTMMLRQATSGAIAHGSSASIHNEAMSIVKLRRFLGVSTSVEIKIVNRKGHDWVIVYCNKETYNLKDKFSTLEMTYRKGAVDKTSNRQSIKNTHSVIQSVVSGIPLSGSAKSSSSAVSPANQSSLYEKETRSHYQGKGKMIEAKLAASGL